MYQVIEAQRDFLIQTTQQWKVTIVPYLYMYTCLYDYLPFITSLYYASQARVTSLEGQLVALRVVDDDEDKASNGEEEEDDDDQTNDPPADPTNEGDDDGGEEE